MNIGEKIVVLRKRNKLSQDDLAKKMNISRQAVSRWEQGLSIPDIDSLKNLKNIFKVNYDMLLDDSVEITMKNRYFTKKDYIMILLIFLILILLLAFITMVS